MKNFRVTVNGNTYDVAVEEIGGNSPSQSFGSFGSSAPAPAKAPAPKAPVSSGTEGNIKIKSPMPGTIVDIKVSIGDKIDTNSVVVVLEAMKMENEIVTPSSGTVASINVSKGSSVNTDDILITISE